MYVELGRGFTKENISQDLFNKLHDEMQDIIWDISGYHECEKCYHSNDSMINATEVTLQNFTNKLRNLIGGE